MQSSIPLGYVLRERYVIQRVLGQGGMGRTYLAEDTERFNELCVLKEFIPQSALPDSVAKAKELFRREASLLYQIDHPQIPKFRASFEIEGRLFLVQDFVEGKTYRALLRERQLSGKVFHEMEVVNLLQQVLLILQYLHDRQIIHRDISPENLMLRTQDQLPVLIDFGVGKEVATQLHDIWGATIAGKPGYASPEQLRTGQVFPSSDIYALAVTALVLLTGRDPQELFDEVHLTWQWQRYTSLSASLSEVLERMLRQKPADRFSDAREVLLHLHHAQSDVRTLAVDRHRPAATAIPDYTLVAEEAAPEMTRRRSRNPRAPGGARWLIGLAWIGLAGVGSWVVTSWWLNRPNPPVAVAPVSPALPNTLTKDLDFGADPAKAAIADQIQGGQKIIYRLTAKKNQTMAVSLTGANLEMTLLYEDQQPIDDRSSNVSLGYWQGKLPASGAYFIAVKALPAAQSQEFSLTVALETPTPVVTPSPKPNPSPKPLPDPTPAPIESPPSRTTTVRDIQFPAGSTGTMESGKITPSQRIQYNVNLAANQTLTVFHEGNVQVEILDPNGVLQRDERDGNPKTIEGTIGGTYQITVVSETDSDYQLFVDAF